VIFNFFSSPLTAVDQAGEEVPAGVMLYQNYPNPFNPGTTITYTLPKSSQVRLSVYDYLGREVAVLVNEKQEAGVRAVRFETPGLSTGVYLCRVRVGEITQTRRMLLVK
jgi:hypothetical protein